MVKSRVAAVCTTDDPDDTLEWHDAIAKDFKEVKVLPTWRPDRILKAAVKDGTDPMPHLAERHAFFGDHGSIVSDYGLDTVPTGRHADLLVECMKLDAAAGRVSQLHFNCIRNPNSARFSTLGPDTGFDAVSDAGGIRDLAAILDRLEAVDSLPKTILYSLNPSDTPALQALAGSFQKAPYLAKVQVGSAWWFNDHLRGMEAQLESLMALGFGIIASSLTTRYRDLRVLVDFGIRLWMFVTPVVYPLSQFGGSYLETVLTFNPMTAPLEAMRWCLWGAGHPSFLGLAYFCMVTIAVLLVGIVLFNKVERTFMDTV